MKSKRVFLDHNSTTNLLPEVASEVAKLISLNQPMNSSSTHFFGQQARAMVENARAQLLGALGASCCYDAIFTSCGTESNNQVLQSFIGFGVPVLCSNVEHASVLDFAKRGLVKTIAVKTSDGDGAIDDCGSGNYAGDVGLLDLECLKSAIDEIVEGRGDDNGNAGDGAVDDGGVVCNFGEPVRFVLSLCHANNETGIVQDVKKIAEIVHSHGGLLHCDCSQSFGKVPLNLKESGIDIATVSSHKIGGLMGAAGVVFANSVTLGGRTSGFSGVGGGVSSGSGAGGLPIKALILGGGQERGLRSGTLNCLAIFSFGLAAQIASQNIKQYVCHTAKLSKKISDFVQSNGGTIINDFGVEYGDIDDADCGDDADVSFEKFCFCVRNLPNTLSIFMPNVSKMSQIMQFDLAGIAISAGSACSSGKVDRSYVLGAMGVDDKIADNTIRVTCGLLNTDEDIEAFNKKWLEIANKKR